MYPARFKTRLKAPSLILTLACAMIFALACSNATGEMADDEGGDTMAAESGGSAAQGSSARAAGDTATWNRVLKAHARDGGVDYAALAEDTGDLDSYLAYVAKTDPGSLSDDDRLAFLSNAYNAYVVQAVLDRYPEIESVKKVGGFFDKEIHTVGGEDMTLDAIEGMAREIDARTHFAVVCASTSCPDLRGEAFTGARIDEQLREQTESFLADESKGLRHDAGSNELYLSSIFKWYAQDFTGGSRVVAFFSRGGILEWVVEHLGDEKLASSLKDKEPSVKYMDYDWSLNDR